jgi:hypothetical protein
MKRTWTIIGVRDVPRSFKWYQSLFGQRATGPARKRPDEIDITIGSLEERLPWVDLVHH